MARPIKSNPELQQRIGDNVALGLTYSLAAKSCKNHIQNIKYLDEQGENRKIWEIFSVL